jgi:DNA modification methylase
MITFEPVDLSTFLPESLRQGPISQDFIPILAKDEILLKQIETIIKSLPSQHKLFNEDSTIFNKLEDNSIHLVITSPPYWTLKRYNDSAGQLGHVEDYEEFIEFLDSVWKMCFNALVPGGRLICVVGDVCLSRRKNAGEHVVIPLHATIQEHTKDIGFNNLSPIIWHKISNAQYEVEGNSRFLGKPYEPNGIIKNDIEFILMERKPGGYRSPTMAERILSVIPDRLHKVWFQQIWEGITGASTKNHPAPFPEDLIERLIRMFSFVGDTVLDPFMGSGTTNVVAAKWGRNSIGIELDKHYFEAAKKRLALVTRNLFNSIEVEINAAG